MGVCPSLAFMAQSWDNSWLARGPRGRRLCYRLLTDDGPFTPPWSTAWRQIADLDRPAVVRGLAARIAEPLPTDVSTMHAALAESTRWAMYWQPPDGVDLALALPDIVAMLQALADDLGTHVPDWWSSSVDLETQVAVVWHDNVPNPLKLTGTTSRLQQWRVKELEDESQVRGTGDASHGRWWSSPVIFGLPVTTRALPSLPLGAALLAFVEDDMGWEAAECIPVKPTRNVRLYEVATAQDWAGLVRRYPLEVTRSRGPQWHEATGRSGRWFIPDYAAAAKDWDGVHLRARGYLEAAGRVLSIGDGATMLAGFSPDATYWLTDCLFPAGPSQQWTHDPAANDQLAWSSS